MYVCMYSVANANPKWQNMVDFSNLKIKPPYTALEPTLWSLFQYISAHLIQLVSFCGPVVHTESNYMTGKLAASKIRRVVDLRVKS